MEDNSSRISNQYNHIEPQLSHIIVKPNNNKGQPSHIENLTSYIKDQPYWRPIQSYL